MPPSSLHLPDAPPADPAELFGRARSLAGHTLGELAAAAGVDLPRDLGRDKGRVGLLLERVLGANASQRARPDFEALGVELKTLPVDGAGRPLQSTYVTKVPLRGLADLTWQGSAVCRKLRRVLWVPVQGERQVALAHRVVGLAFAWSPSDDEDALLCADWELHLARLRLGQVDAIRGSDGAVLQVRPKARDGQAWVRIQSPASGPRRTRPRGFYLRPCFTRYLLRCYVAEQAAEAARELARAIGVTTER